MSPASIQKLVFTLVLSVFIFPLTYSQSDCSERLREAQRSFDAGHPQEALELIKNCIGGFTADQAIQALRLKTIVQLLEKDPQTDETFKQLLKLNPEFRVDTSLDADPPSWSFYTRTSIRTPGYIFGSMPE